MIYVAGPIEEKIFGNTTNYDLYREIGLVFGELNVPVMFPESIASGNRGSYFDEIVRRIRASDALIVLRQFGRVHEAMEISIAGMFGKYQLIISDFADERPRLLNDIPKLEWSSSRNREELHDELVKFAQTMGLTRQNLTRQG